MASRLQKITIITIIIDKYIRFIPNARKRVILEDSQTATIAPVQVHVLAVEEISGA